MKGLSKYSQIALDLAHKIVQGELSVGERIYGRSTLAAFTMFRLKLFVAP